MEQKLKFDFFHFLGNLTMGNSNLKTFLMILVSIFEIRASKKRGEHQFWIKSVNRTFFLNEIGLQKRKIRQKWPKMNQKWTKSVSIKGFLDKSTLKEYEIVLNFNDWVSNF
jgi:hypothetical protein